MLWIICNVNVTFRKGNLRRDAKKLKYIEHRDFKTIEKAEFNKYDAKIIIFKVFWCLFILHLWYCPWIISNDRQDLTPFMIGFTVVIECLGERSLDIFVLSQELKTLILVVLVLSVLLISLIYHFHNWNCDVWGPLCVPLGFSILCILYLEGTWVVVFKLALRTIQILGMKLLRVLILTRLPNVKPVMHTAIEVSLGAWLALRPIIKRFKVP